MKHLTRLFAATAALTLLSPAAATSAFAAPSDTVSPTNLLVSGEAEWSYLDDDTDPADGLPDRTDWTDASFDDSAWPTASGSFGALRGELDELNGGFTPDNLLRQYKDGEGVPNTEAFFFRTDLTVDAQDLEDAGQLAGTVRYDDAATIFINGERVAGFHDDDLDLPAEGERRNMQYGGSNSSAPREGTFEIDPEVLEPGENSIAVQLHQGRATSSDLYFDFEDLSLEPEPGKVGPTSVLLGVGSTPAERSLSWFTDGSADEVVQIAPGEHTDMPSGVQTVQPSDRGESEDGTHDYVHAAVTGLEHDTTYSYRVGSEEDGWSDVYTFRNHDADLEHSFTFMGDAQIGASGSVEDDGEGWQTALDAANEYFPDSHFMLSAGDQINDYGGDPAEYRAYLEPEQMATQTNAQTLGNHDYNRSGPQALFGQHFVLPNQSESDESEGSYWFKQNGVLHLNISTENQDYDEHRRFLEEVIEAEGDDAAWTVLTFHRSIYSVGITHSQSSTTKANREGLAPIISDLDIDMVLAGHDHSYARTHLMDGTEISNEEAETAPEGHDQLHPEDGEMLYVTANSSTGSKYYSMSPSLLTPWAAVRDQSNTPTTTQVEVGECSITTTTVQVDDGEEVDKVELVKDATAPEILTPGDTELTMGDEFDPMAGVEASDECGELTDEGITVDGTVDTATAGTYDLTYSATDTAGNEGTATRTITVAEAPSPEPTGDPSETPTDEPTEQPTGEPTQDPTDESTEEPSGEPSEDPTGEPTEQPSEDPSGEPTDQPTDGPSDDPRDDSDEGRDDDHQEDGQGDGEDDAPQGGQDDGGDRDGGGREDSDRNEGGDLPRTGATLAGLGAGVTLLGAGIAAVVASRRRKA